MLEININLILPLSLHILEPVTFLSRTQIFLRMLGPSAVTPLSQSVLIPSLAKGPQVKSILWYLMAKFDKGARWEPQPPWGWVGSQSRHTFPIGHLQGQFQQSLKVDGAAHGFLSAVLGTVRGQGGQFSSEAE